MITSRDDLVDIRGRRASDSVSLIYEDGLEDDDCSYIMGSKSRSDETVPPYNEEEERKKQITIEKLYWPFHRLFDIHGIRRLTPVKCPRCSGTPCKCNAKEEKKLLKDYDFEKFTPPLSDRKDGGMEMDTSGFKMPMLFRSPKGLQPYVGKVFYMGVIDILQEYNARKAIETQYRFISASNRLEPSCVPPADYGDRFIVFFDEYTSRGTGEDNEGLDVSGEIQKGSSGFEESRKIVKRSSDGDISV
jgi:hypothetical protein